MLDLRRVRRFSLAIGEGRSGKDYGGDQSEDKTPHHSHPISSRLTCASITSIPPSLSFRQGM